MTPRTFVISGASGWLGTALTAHLEAAGHSVRRLVRRAPADRREFVWDPAAGTIDAAAFAGADAVIHLAGEGIAEARWTASRKALILKSRVDGTRCIARAVAASGNPHLHLISASAVGYYGQRGDQPLYESAAPGEGFLSDVCREWEAEADRAASFGIRVVKIRIGLVLGRDGGALAAMLLPFRLGLGARLGDGRQWMSWIHLEDLTGMIRFALANDQASGAWNGVAPNPVTNAAFTRALGAALRRPAFFWAPEFVIRLGAGEMAQILFNSQRCAPAAPLAAGFRFRFPELGPALHSVLS